MKKGVIVFVVLCTLVAIPVAVTFAQSSSPGANPSISAKPERKNTIEIGPAGRALVRGTLKSKATSTVVVSSWGGDWTIRLHADTKIQPKILDTSLAGFEVGDFVGVNGKIAEGQPWTVDASLIRNWTERREIRTTHKEIEKQKKEDRKDGIGRNFEGTVTSVASSTLAMTVEGASHAVNYGAGTLTVNKLFGKISPSDIRVGDKLVVWGTRSSSTIAATIIRDLSIPR